MRVSPRRCSFPRILLLAALVSLGGCGGVGKPVKVHGVLTLDGKPLAGATITFTPAQGDGKPAYGRSESDGSFLLTTFKPDDGALPGDYKVTVTYSEPDKAADAGDPMKMDDKAKMAFFMRMSPEGKAKAEREKKKTGGSVPTAYTSPTTTPLKMTVPVNGKAEINLRSTAR